MPGVRVEYTRLSLDSSAPNVDSRNGTAASLTRVVPGVAMLVRPNIRVVLWGDFRDTACSLPPAGSWGAAGGLLVPNKFDSTTGKYAPNAFEAEQINATLNVAY